MLLASYMKQGLPAPTLALGNATSSTRKRQGKDDFDAVSSSTAGLSWKMKKWQKGLHLKQQSCYPESEEMSEELPVLISASSPVCCEMKEISDLLNELKAEGSVTVKPLENNSLAENSVVQPTFPMEGCYTRYA